MSRTCRVCATATPTPGRWLSVLTLSLVLAACSPPQPLSEQELVDTAGSQFENRSFSVAVLNYQELLEQFPFSDHAQTARLKIAHAYYLAGKYESAIAAFNDFERLHPTSRDLPFVEYTVAMCHFDQSLKADRDSSSTQRALRHFERLLARYPDSVYGRLATYRIAQSKERLAKHELNVADFYRESGRDEAAQARYRFIIEHYPDTRTALKVARRLGKS